MNKFISLETSNTDKKLQVALKEAIAQCKELKYCLEIICFASISLLAVSRLQKRIPQQNSRKDDATENNHEVLEVYEKIPKKRERHQEESNIDQTEQNADDGNRRSTRRTNYIQRDIEKELDRFLRTHEEEDENLIATDFAFMYTLQDLLLYAEKQSRALSSRLSYRFFNSFLSPAKCFASYSSYFRLDPRL